MLVLSRHRGDAVIIRKNAVDIATVRVVTMGDFNLRLRFSGAENIEFVPEKSTTALSLSGVSAMERDEIAVLQDGVEVARIWVVEIGRRKARIGFGGDLDTIKFIRAEIAGTEKDFQVNHAD